MRRAEHTSRDTPWNVSIDGYPAVRFQKLSTARRYCCLPLLCSHLKPFHGESHIPGGCHGYTLGPYIESQKAPLRNNAWSRICSADKRTLTPLAKYLFAGSFCNNSCDTFESCL